jgi:hypothetical protein
MPRLVLLTTLFVVVLPWELLAQESRPFGLVFGAPANVGVLWQAAKRLAIRPDVSFSWASTETTSELSIGLAPGGVQSSIVTRGRTEHGGGYRPQRSRQRGRMGSRPRLSGPARRL